MRQIRRMLVASLAVAATASPSPVAAAPKPHPFTARDMQGMERISDPQPSPGGDRIAFVVSSADFGANKRRTDLWWVGTDGSGLARLTSHEASDTNPRWAPDGASIYFLSTRSGSSQVWRLGLAGGEAIQVTRLPLDIANLMVSPDGKRLAFSLEVFADCETIACTTERLAKREKETSSGRHYRDGAGLYRHWDTCSDGRRNHLFVMPVAGGEPRDLTRGMNADVPSRPFGGTEEFAFSPDGATLVFAARDASRAEPWSTDFDLYLVPADGARKPRNLTDTNPAWDSYPAFSPDGKQLAYLAMTRAGYEADRFHVRLRDLAGGGDREVAPDWDRSPDELLFASDGRTLYATADDLGHHPLFAIDLESGAVRKLVGDGHVTVPHPCGGRLCFGRDDLRSPVELYSAGTDGTGLQQVTKINAEKLAAVTLGEPEQFHFSGAAGETVYGWVVKPAGSARGRRHPMALLIHGGPQSAFGNLFHYRWNAQAFAGAGYGVVLIDFHGSAGYGQAFTDSITRDWGGKPLEDLQKGLAAALAAYPWLDGDRACALGGSYGGYMVSWIAGQWPDRFRCLVNHDGVFDLRTNYFATEELWFPEHDFGGPYWSRAELYEKWNPVNFVERWKAPMLVIHGALDYRVPETQGIGAFNTLQRRGIPSEFLFFPDENHWVLKPNNSVQWYDTVLGWLERWVGSAR